MLDLREIEFRVLALEDRVAKLEAENKTLKAKTARKAPVKE